MIRVGAGTDRSGDGCGRGYLSDGNKGGVEATAVADGLAEGREAKAGRTKDAGRYPAVRRAPLAGGGTVGGGPRAAGAVGRRAGGVEEDASVRMR